MNKSFSGVLYTVVLAFGLVSAIEAAPMYSASTRLMGFNEISSNYFLGSDLTPADSSLKFGGANAVSSLNGQYSVSGMDTGGDLSTLTLTYDGASQTSASGEFKARSFVTLQGGFFNAQNSPFVLDSDLNTDPNGVPGQFHFSSGGTFSDTLSVQGAANLSSIVLSIDLDGELLVLDSSTLYHPTSVSVQIGQVNNGFNILFLSGTEGLIDETIKTTPIQVINGVANLNLSLRTNIDLDLTQFVGSFYDNPANVPTLGGSADFFNTLTIASIAGFDVNGNPVDLASATGSTGFQFTTVRVNQNNVPEPSTLLLIGLGLTSLLGFNRRKLQTNYS